LVEGGALLDRTCIPKTDAGPDIDIGRGKAVDRDYIADCAIRWRTIIRKTPYCTANAASLAPTAPTETNHAQVAKSKRSAMTRLARRSAARRAAQAQPAVYSEIASENWLRKAA